MGQFMLDHGIADGHEVVPAGWTEDATARHVADPPYGYFWWIVPGGYEAEGIFGQTLSVFPEERLVVVINSAWPAAWSRDIDAVRKKYLAAIRAAAH
jgi:CubicO group peptidase (beta-lactamase class C family)